MEGGRIGESETAVSVRGWRVEWNDTERRRFPRCPSLECIHRMQGTLVLRDCTVKASSSFKRVTGHIRWSVTALHGVV